jgi:hypothetical protein
MDLDVLSPWVVKNDRKVLLVVLDGLGGLAGPDGMTSSEAANTTSSTFVSFLTTKGESTSKSISIFLSLSSFFAAADSSSYFHSTSMVVITPIERFLGFCQS